MNKLQLRPPSGATRPVELIQGRCFKKLGSSPTYTLKNTICTTIAPSTASTTVDRVIDQLSRGLYIAEQDFALDFPLVVFEASQRKTHFRGKLALAWHFLFRNASRQPVLTPSSSSTAGLSALLAIREQCTENPFCDFKPLRSHK